MAVLRYPLTAGAGGAFKTLGELLAFETLIAVWIATNVGKLTDNFGIVTPKNGAFATFSDALAAHYKKPDHVRFTEIDYKRGNGWATFECVEHDQIARYYTDVLYVVIHDDVLALQCKLAVE